MLIDLGQFSKKQIIILISTPVAMFLSSFFRYNLNKENHNLFFMPFLNYLSKILNFILWFILFSSVKEISRKRKKIKNNPILTEKVDIESKTTDSSIGMSQTQLNILAKRQKERIKLVKKIVFLIIIGILDFVSTFINNIVSQTDENKNLGYLTLFSFTRFIAIYCFSYFFLLHKNVHIHQTISIIIIIIITISLNLYSILINTTSYNYNYIYGGSVFISEIMFGIMYVLGNKYLLISDGNIYKLLFYNGLISLILLLLSQLFTDEIGYIIPKDIFDNNKTNNTITNLFDEIMKYKSNYILYILYLVNLFIEVALIWTLIFFYSVIRFAAVCSIPLLFQYIYELIYKSKEFSNVDIILLIFASLVSLFFSFVCNEVIILRFWGLDQNTIENILKRERIDSSICLNEGIGDDSLMSDEGQN